MLISYMRSNRMNQKRAEYHNIPLPKKVLEQSKVEEESSAQEKSVQVNSTKNDETTETSNNNDDDDDGKMIKTESNYKDLHEYPEEVQAKMKSLLKSALKNKEIKISEQRLKHPSKKSFFLFKSSFYRRAAKTVRRCLDPLLPKKYQSKKVQFNIPKDSVEDKNSEREVPMVNQSSINQEDDESSNQDKTNSLMASQGEEMVIRRSPRFCNKM